MKEKDKKRKRNERNYLIQKEQDLETAEKRKVDSQNITEQQELSRTLGQSEIFHGNCDLTLGWQAMM